MEVLRKNALSEQCSFDIQEIKEIPTKSDSSIGEDQNEDITKRYVSCYDLIASSALMDQDKEYPRNAKTIVLEQNQASDRGRVNNVSRRVIELSDNDSKMILRRQFGEMTECKNSNMQSGTGSCENMEILQKLPPDTIVIRQKAKSEMEDSDYRESNSNSGSSTSGCADVKTKGISRAFRNKTLKTMEVRRNPMRVSKRNMAANFSRPKQRLLANSKKEFYSDYEVGKRVRSSTMPYMNTRSVTRKMYTVGATYQAPTKKDETEWKEWPVHGMHERPVYHPQAGLAVEYLGRYFTSLDGLSYCEIINEPNIEVVSVDPHCDGRVSSAERKGSRGKTRMKSKLPPNTKVAWNSYLSADNKSFETCMHESLHCVFGYCSQVMTPVYKKTVEGKMTKLTSAAKTSSLESAKEPTDLKSNVTISSKNVTKLAEETKLLEAYAIAMAQSIQNKSTANSTNDQKATSTVSSSSATYLPEAQKSTAELSSSKTASQNGGAIRMNLKQIIRGAPNSSLILLRSSAARSTSVATAKNVFNSAKVEDASNDETLMGMSSIYKKLMFTKEPVSKCEKSPVSNNVHSLKRYAMNTPEHTTKKTFLEDQLDNKKTVQVMKEARENKSLDRKMKIHRDSEGRISMTSSSKNVAWGTNKTSEIARILSEYNKGTLRKSTAQNQIYSSRDTKTSLTNPNVKNLPKNLWQKSARIDENQQFVSNSNMSFELPQGKWKRLHLMLEKTKDGPITGGNQNPRKSSSTVENHKVSLRDQQVHLGTSNYIRKNSIDSRKDLNEHEIIMVDVKPKEKNSEYSKDETSEETSKIGSLQELLENTAILYCAANGVHQDDLSNYIDTLDSKQSIQWLESCNNSVI
ncbi:PREDICTED: uncharacterized protein LOC105561214 [Vollenhovia emeryi]|uniref:uncharacterized protein LOC105561214 n=1 Tax=Vollenhovia emeryi TaxID=411798 RepID=UPI0005F40C41|nr:PREDICTED: uncharacterized protein LOC105561214 [Vollenhovia emeryi]